MENELKEKSRKQETLTGTFIANAKGFGFVEIEGQKEDLFVPPGMTGGAMHRDTVEVSILSECPGKRTEAAVVCVLKRGVPREPSQAIRWSQRSRSTVMRERIQKEKWWRFWGMSMTREWTFSPLSEAMSFPRSSRRRC